MNIKAYIFQPAKHIYILVFLDKNHQIESTEIQDIDFISSFTSTQAQLSSPQSQIRFNPTPYQKAEFHQKPQKEPEDENLAELTRKMTTYDPKRPLIVPFGKHVETQNDPPGLSKDESMHRRVITSYVQN